MGVELLEGEVDFVGSRVAVDADVPVAEARFHEATGGAGLVGDVGGELGAGVFHFFRLASEVSLEHLGAPGAAVKPVQPVDGPVLASRDSRQRTVRAGFLGGSITRLTSIEPESTESSPADVVEIAVDLRPQPSDRPDPGQASIFGGGTVAAAEPNFKHAHD